MYDLWDGNLVSSVLMAGDDGHGCVFGALCEMISRIRIQWRLVEAYLVRTLTM